MALVPLIEFAFTSARTTVDVPEDTFLEGATLLDPDTDSGDSALGYLYQPSPLQVTGVGVADQTILPVGILSSESVGNVGLTLTINPFGIQDTESVGNVGVTLTVSPFGIQSSGTVGNVGIAQGISPTGIKSNEIIGKHHVSLSLSTPLRATFYYPWFTGGSDPSFPGAWDQLGIKPYTQYHPVRGYYDQTVNSIIDAHIADMQFGKFDFAISSWWGQGSREDVNFAALLARSVGTNFKWALYYEAEGNTIAGVPGSPNPASAQITADLNYIADNYVSHPNYLWIDGKPVIFAYGDPSDDSAGTPNILNRPAKRWSDANAAATVPWYYVLKVYDVWVTDDATYPAPGWHQYGPSTAVDQQGSKSYTVSPGYWFATTTTPLLVRDIGTFAANVRNMLAASVAFKLITTFNEFGEGTAIEVVDNGSGRDYVGNGWLSTSGHGAYIDVLSANGVAITPSSIVDPKPSVGNVGVAQGISPVGIVSSQSIGNIALTATYTISPIGITTNESSGNPTVSQGAQTVSPVGIPSVETVGRPTAWLGSIPLPTLVNQTVGQGVSSANQNIACTATIGNYLVLIYARSGGQATGAVTSVTDTGGNTWSAAAITRGAVVSVSNTRIEVWVARLTASPGTITVNSGTPQTNSWNISEWSGIASVIPIDVTSPDYSGVVVASTTIPTAIIQSLNPNDLIIAAAHFGQTTTSGLTTGFTALTDFDDAAVGSGRAAYETFGAIGTYNAQWTLGSSHSAGVITIALEVSAVATQTISPVGIQDVETVGNVGVAQVVSPIGIQDFESVGNIALTATYTISPVGIVSNESSGNSAVTATATISPIGIVSSQILGNVGLAQGVSPFGIVDTETVGNVSVIQTVSPFGIQSKEVSGNSTLSLTVNPFGIQDIESVGNPVVLLAQSILPFGIQDFETIGNILTSITIAPTGIRGIESVGTALIESIISTVGIQDFESIGNPSLTVVVAINATGIQDSESVGNVGVTPGAVTIAPTGIQDKESVGNLALTTSNTISLTGILDSESVGNIALSSVNTISPTGIIDSETVGNVGISQTVAPFGIKSSEIIGNIALTTATLTISPVGIIDTETVGNAAVTPGAVTISPTGIQDIESVGNITILQAQQILPTGIIDLESIGNVAVTAGSVTVSPIGIVSTEAVGAASAGLSLAPVGVSTSESVGNPTVTVSTTQISPVGIIDSESVGNVAITTGSVTITTFGIKSGEGVGNPSVSIGAVIISPVGIQDAERLGNVSVTTGAVTINAFGIPSAQLIGNLFASVLQTVNAYGIASAQKFGNVTLTVITVFPSYTVGDLVTKWNVGSIEVKWDIKQEESVWTVSAIEHKWDIDSVQQELSIDGGS